jgi:hypothetical protein
MELRYVLRNGKERLQVQKTFWRSNGSGCGYGADKYLQWVDIPLIDEATGEELVETKDTSGAVNGWKVKEKIGLL